MSQKDKKGLQQFLRIGCFQFLHVGQNGKVISVFGKEFLWIVFRIMVVDVEKIRNEYSSSFDLDDFSS